MIKKLKKINISHGAGGKAMHELIEGIFLKHFSNGNEVVKQEDQARFQLAQLQKFGSKLAFTTDSYVVDPLFFPGGDIGKLSVTGTVNDLAVGGAKPMYLSCSFIIEEGLEISILERVVKSMQKTADEAGVKIVTGDTKVVPQGSCDKLFINTAGIGVIEKHVDIEAGHAQEGDVIIINGFLGDHGAAIVDARGELAIEHSIETDCQVLNGLIEEMLDECPDIHCMRDVTRGGLLTVLNEFAQASKCSIQIQETDIPVRAEVRALCEILGLDPLYLANEGKLVAVVPENAAQSLLERMRKHPAGKDSAIIGSVLKSDRPQVFLQTNFGTKRLADVLVGEQLPRIC